MTPTVRRSIASVFCLLTGVPIWSVLSEETASAPSIVFVALLSLPLVAGMLHIKRLEPQIFSRAVLWSVLVAGALLSFVGRFHKPDIYWLAVSMTAGPGLALLSLGVLGLDAPSSKNTFFPVAFRGVLLAVIVMALADTCSLLFWGGLLLEDTGKLTRGITLFMLSAGSVMITAVYGLYKMRFWGFALNVLANLAIATGAWFVPRMPDPIAACLTATAIGQLVVGVPLIAGLLKGNAAPSGMNTRATQWVSTFVIVALLVATEVARRANGA